MYRKTAVLAVLSLTIFYFTTHIIFETLYGKRFYFFLLLCFFDILENTITACIVCRILRREKYFSYGVIFSTLYVVLLVSAYIAFQIATHNLVFLEKYWIYFPSLLSVVYMSAAVGVHLLIFYVLSKCKRK